MKWRAVFTVGAVAAVLVGVWRSPLVLSDIREPAVDLGTPARVLLDGAQLAHGGLVDWQSHEWVELDLRGRVSARARLGFRLRQESVEVRVRFVPTGPVTAMAIGGVEQDIAADTGSGLLAASLQHLFELPFAMDSVDVLQRVADAEGHRRLFAGWGTDAPQRASDQYVLWLDADGKLTRFGSTARRILPFLVTRVSLTEHVDVEGFSLPGRVVVNREPAGGSPVMTWELIEARIGPVSSVKVPGPSS